jgi:hypothetical protein
MRMSLMLDKQSKARQEIEGALAVVTVMRRF